MSNLSPAHPMAKQCSALNTFWLIKYLSRHHPEVSVGEILDQLAQKGPLLVENIHTGRLEAVTQDHLTNPDYWFSNDFILALYDAVQQRVPDPRLFYRMGRTSYRAQQLIKTAIGIPLLGGEKVVAKVSHEASKFNRTRRYAILKNIPGHALIEMSHIPGAAFSDPVVRWHQGMFAAYARLLGATEVDIAYRYLQKEDCPGDREQVVCRFDIRYTPPNLLRRLFQVFIGNIPFVKKIIEDADLIQLEQKEQILNRDQIIRERTEKISQLQEEVAAAERQLLEQSMGGGFAHEMRNALAGALLELKAYRNYRNQDQSAAQVLEQAVVQLFTAIDRLQLQYQLPADEIGREVLPWVETIARLASELGDTMEGVRADIERGLAITREIQDYAALNQRSPGQDEVDLVAVLHHYGRKFAGQLKEQATTFRLEGCEQATVLADQGHIYSIFSNLLNNARESLAGVSVGQERRIVVRVEPSTDKKHYQIRVSDNGPGIAPEQEEMLFQPFYTTKPATGTGLGLGVVAKLTSLYQGEVTLSSCPHQETTFTIILPAAPSELS
ncbi:sensor histidine kinase [Desulfogranum mediterraneum]|uniref:sensor histidine kinase n=1 Tax=Desulfogranum mediterraneum TaxID=160661 RepID=UPI0012947273|nr:HAMP domain-containing sensor histidine kinase [Desulfogranum mediterraneum]